MAQRRRRQTASIPQMMLTPMVDVIFNLLLFFMLVTHFVTPTVDLTLPRSTSAAVNDAKSVMVTLDAAGGVLVNNQPVTWDTLTSVLKAQAGTAQLVRLRADAETRHKDVIHALDCIRAAGLSEIAIEAERSAEAVP